MWAISHFNFIKASLKLCRFNAQFTPLLQYIQRNRNPFWTDFATYLRTQQFIDAKPARDVVEWLFYACGCRNFFTLIFLFFIFIWQIPFAGESFKQVRIGQLVTQIGSLTMAVAYRTKMTISPTQTGRDNAIMLKSDHFLKDLSPKHLRYTNYKKKWVILICAEWTNYGREWIWKYRVFALKAPLPCVGKSKLQQELVKLPNQFRLLALVFLHNSFSGQLTSCRRKVAKFLPWEMRKHNLFHHRACTTLWRGWKLFRCLVSYWGQLWNCYFRV